MTQERLSFHVRVTSPRWGGVFTCTGDTVRAHVPIEVLTVLLAPRLTTIASVAKCTVISGSSNQGSSRLCKASMSSDVTVHAEETSVSASVSVSTDSEGGGVGARLWVTKHWRTSWLKVSVQFGPRSWPFRAHPVSRSTRHWLSKWCCLRSDSNQTTNLPLFMALMYPKRPLNW